MNDHIEVLRGLVAEWRALADSGSPVATDYNAGARWAYAVLAAELEAALAALSAQAEACRCVDCGGDQPSHAPGCAYMRDLHGEQPEAQAGGEVAFNYAMVHRFATENRINYNALAKLVRECVYTTPPPGAVPEGMVLVPAQGVGGSKLKHKFKPDEEYPWFCGECGYSERETLVHIAAPGPKEGA